MKGKKTELDAKVCNHGLRFLESYFIWRLRAPTHGYALINEIKISPMLVRLKPARVYSVLNGLEERGLISSTNRLVGGRTRKVYAATQKGRRELDKAKKLKIPPKIREFVREIFFSDG